MKPKTSSLDPISQEQRLSVRDLSILLRRSVSGIWAAVQRGEFPEPERYGKRCTRWKWGTVQDFIENNQTGR